LTDLSAEDDVVSFPYQRILCPVDLDDHSASALQEAGAIAGLCKATLWLLHVVKINPLATEGFVLAELEESQSQHARTVVSELAKRLLSNADYEIKIVIGEPAEQILAQAGELRADLLVMATHGRHGIPRLVLGSVAEKIVRESTVPVLTVRIPAG
jgi:nucleotide-binding universal stress UspA family protein